MITLSKEIDTLSTEHKRLVSSNEFYNNNLANEFDIFRRYTSSKSDSSPQGRLCQVIRKNWPIVCQNNKFPLKYNGRILQSTGREIGTNDKRRASIHFPDFLSKYGDKCELNVATSLIEMELANVKEFFSLEIGEMTFRNNSITRKPVRTQPRIEGVASSMVNDTLLKFIGSDVLSSKTESNLNVDALKRLDTLLYDLQNYKSFDSVIHIARNMLTEKVKWLPTTGIVNPAYSEFSHMITSRFHSISISQEVSNIDSGIERICFEIIRIALGQHSPKSYLIKTITDIKINGADFEVVLESVRNDKPATNIVRAVLGMPVNIQSKVRDTTFIIIEQEAPRRQEISIWNYGAVMIQRSYYRFHGLAKVYFERNSVKGYFIVRDKEIIRIFFNEIENYDSLELLLDIVYYCAAIRNGFTEPYDLYIDQKDIERHYFQYYKRSYTNTLKFVMTLKSDHENGKMVSNSCIVTNKTSGYLEKIYPLTEPIQPYDQTKREVSVTEALKVFVEKEHGKELVLTPNLLKRPQSALPSGITTANPILANLLVSEINKMSLILTSVLSNKQAFDEYLDSAVNEKDSDYRTAVSSSFHPTEAQKSAKRTLSVMLNNEEDVFGNPAKRYKAVYLSTVAMTAIPGTNRTGLEPYPSNITLIKNNETLELSRKRGLVTGKGEEIVVMGKRLKMQISNHDYVLIGIFSRDKEVVICKNVEEAIEKGYERFQIHIMGSYYFYQKKEVTWNISDNINNTFSECLRVGHYLEMIGNSSSSK